MIKKLAISLMAGSLMAGSVLLMGAPAMAQAQSPNGLLFQQWGHKRVYIMNSAGQLQWITSGPLFQSMGENWGRLVHVDTLPGPVVAPITLVRLNGHNAVYLIQNDSLHWIPSSAVFNQLGLQWDQITAVNYLPYGIGNEAGVPSPTPTPTPAPTPAPTTPTTANWIAMARPVYAPSSEQTYASWWQEQFGSVNAQGTIFVTSAGSNPQVILFTPPASAASPPQSVQALDQWFAWMNAHNAGIYYLAPAQAAGFPDEVNGAMVEQLPLTTLQQQDRGAYWTNQNTTSPDDAYTNHDLPF